MKNVVSSLVFLSIAVISGGFGFLLFFLVTGLWRRTAWGRKIAASKKRSPVTKDALLRPAGYGLQLKITDSTTDLLFLGLSSSMIPALGVMFYILSNGHNVIPTLIILGIVLIVCLIKLRRMSKKLEQYRLGLDGEMATAEDLTHLLKNGFHIFHDLANEHFNIDHVVIGPTGVFAVETKARSKRTQSGEKGALVKQMGDVLKFPGFEDDRSIKQAREQGKWLSEFLSKSVGKKITVTPVLAIPGWYVERGPHDGSVLVYSPNNGSKLFTNRPTALDEQTIKQAAYQVEQRCRDVTLFNPL